MNRRDFLRQTSGAAATLGLFPASLSAVEREIKQGSLERRALGQTGEKLSIVAFGGIVLNESTPEQAAQWVRQAFEAGVNHFDVAPEYGSAEIQMGPALAPFRKDVFLSSKTAKRRRSEAATELDRSLQRLRTDHLDLYLLHHVTDMQEVETIFGDDGVIKALEQAKRDGKVRFLGFSAHSVEAALAMMERFAFDAIMFPVNYATWHAGNFGPQVLAKAQEKKLGILALKALAKRPWPQGADRSAHPNCWYEPMTDPDEALMGLRFTLSHPVTTALLPGSQTCQQLGIKLAAKFTPLRPEEVEAMKLKGLAATPLFRHGKGA
jgi:predicted aldo/keto reductase-like oxidoreductase